MRLVGSEQDLTFQIAQYLNYKYPAVMYHFDYGSGVKLTMGQAVRNKRLNKRAYPDLFIAEARHGCHGLFIEVKRASSSPYKADGTLKADKHLAEQQETLTSLQNRSYQAVFGCGYAQIVQIIDSYLQ